MIGPRASLLVLVLSGCLLDESGIGGRAVEPVDAGAEAGSRDAWISCLDRPDYEACGDSACLSSGRVVAARCVAGACVVVETDCCGGCRPALAPGCYVRDDGAAACGCFLSAGDACR